MTHVTSFLDTALAYQGVGLSVIPDRPKDKVPDVDWLPYQKSPASKEQIYTWWKEKPDRNVGLVTGAVSRGLVILDFDSQAPFAAFCEQFPELLQTRIHLSGSGHGFHVLFFVKRVPESKYYPTVYGRVEVKANGMQVVMPPSIHPCGNPYTVHFRERTKHLDDLQNVIMWLVLSSPPEAPRAERGASSAMQRSPLSKRTEDFLKWGATPGERNNSLFRAACDMAGCGYTEDTAATQLIDAARRSGFDNSFSESSARKTIRSAFRIDRVSARPNQMPSAKQALSLWAKRTGRA